MLCKCHTGVCTQPHQTTPTATTPTKPFMPGVACPSTYSGGGSIRCWTEYREPNWAVRYKTTHPPFYEPTPNYTTVDRSLEARPLAHSQSSMAPELSNHPPVQSRVSSCLTLVLDFSPLAILLPRLPTTPYQELGRGVLPHYSGLVFHQNGAADLLPKPL